MTIVSILSAYAGAEDLNYMDMLLRENSMET